MIRASKDDLLAQLRDLRPILANLSAAGDSLAPGLNLLVSFPFPKEASEIVLGDYANTSIKAEISLENLIPKGDLLGIPGLDLSLTLDQLDQVAKCLRSLSIGSSACRAVLRSLPLLPELTKRCKSAQWRSSLVCRALGGVGGLVDGVLGGLGLGGKPTDLAGMGRFTAALASGDPSPRTDTESLLTGALS